MTDLVTIDQKEIMEMANAAGATEQRQEPAVPRLVNNNRPKDDNGNRLDMGAFYLKGVEPAVYADTVTFRPFTHGFQYLEYDPNENKLVNKTRIINSFQEEARDMLGGERCGKPKSSYFKELSEDDAKKAREEYKNITCFRQVRGVVSYEGKTADGETVVVENRPCILMLKGTNFMPFEKKVVKNLPAKTALFQYAVEISAIEHVNGSVYYYEMDFKPDFSNPLPVDQDVVETLKVFVDMISKENEYVDEAYDKAQRGEVLDAEADDVIDDLTSDLDDEIPF